MSVTLEPPTSTRRSTSTRSIAARATTSTPTSRRCCTTAPPPRTSPPRPSSAPSARRAPSTRASGGPRAWLFGIARNAALDELRRRKRAATLDAEPADAAPAPDDAAERALERAAVRAALAGLAPREREVIALKFHAGLDNAELAAVLGVSSSNAGTQLHRAMTKLREAVDDAPDTLPPELPELGRAAAEDPPRPDRSGPGELDARAAAGFPGRRADPVCGAQPARLLSCVPAARLRRDRRCSCVGIVDGELDDRRGSGSAGDSGVGGGGADAAAEPAAAASGAVAPRPRRRPAPSRLGDRQPRRVPSRPPAAAPRLRRPRRARTVERSAALTLAAPRARSTRSPTASCASTDSGGGFVASSTCRPAAAAAAPSSCASRPTGSSARSPSCPSSATSASARRRRSDITAQSVSARERLQEARARARGPAARARPGRHAQRDRERPGAAARREPRDRHGARGVRRVDNRAALRERGASSWSPTRGAGADDDDGAWTPGDALGDAVRVLEVAAGVALIAPRCCSRWRCSAASRWLAGRAARPPPARAGARHGLIVADRMPRWPRARRTRRRCWAGSRSSRSSARATSRGSPRSPSRGVPRRRGRLPRGRRLRHLLRRPLRPRPGDPRARRRPPDHARDVRAGRHLRRAGDVRRRAPLGHGGGDRRPRGARDPRRRHARAAARATPTSRSSS